MCSDLKCLKIVRSLLKNRVHWTLECATPVGLEPIGQKATLYASKRLSNMSLLFLWQRYKKWVKSEPMIKNSDDYFHAFISDTAYLLTKDHLKDKNFEDNCYFKFKFI